MFDQIETATLSALQMIFDQFGWLGVFALMVFENATGITPSEIILAFAGWMLIERHGIAPGFILVAGVYAGLGSTIGASITYWAARIGGRPMIEKFVKWFRMDMYLINKADEKMQQWGIWLILLGRMTPGLRVLINIPAGIARIPFPKFFLATFIGAYVWCTLLLGAGYVLGYEWKLISEIIKTHLPLVLSLGLLGIGVYMIYQYRARIPVLARFQINKKMDNKS